jgi:mannose-6-phosphate isomerase-like protein (cupin superfamily)
MDLLCSSFHPLPARIEEDAMKTIDLGPDEIEHRIARVDDLTANKAEFAARLGIPVEAYEYVAAKSIFLLMAKPKPAEKQNSQPAIEGPAGTSFYVVETPPGDGSLPHAHMRTWESFMPQTGRYRFDYGRGARHSVTIEPHELFSVPPGVIRCFTNIEDHDARMFVFIQGENDADALADVIFPPEIGEEIVQRWGDDVLAKMKTLGFGFDADVETADAAE